MSTDARTNLYQNFHDRQLVEQEPASRRAAEKILAMLREYFAPQSLLDVGCGLGSWLKVAQDLGLSDLRGLEGPWIQDSPLVVDPTLIQQMDLESPFTLGRRYDLAVCLEVAEHLSPAAATGFVDSLVAHADHILFSAAVPFQGGHHHLNEQLLSYWIAHFARHDYIPLDLFRARLWIDQSIPWWLRQNLILFVRRTALESNPALLAESKINRPLAIIHPDLYLARLQSAHQVQQSYAKLMTLFQQGGNFSVHRTPDGNLNISRLP